MIFEVEILRLEPGDILVFKVGKNATGDDIKRIGDYSRDILKGANLPNRALIVGPELKVSVVNPEEEDPDQLSLNI